MADKKIYWLVAILIIVIVSLFFYKFPSESSNQDQYGMMQGHQMHMIITSEEEFIFEMVPHHQEAVDTARIIVENTGNQELKTLAQNIINAQTSEIQMLNSWKDEFYPQSSYVPLYTEMMPPLEDLEGEELDSAFIQGMIMHHQMAIMMAQQVLNLNPRQEVRDFANGVIEVQSAEIKQMQEMLKDY